MPTHRVIPTRRLSWTAFFAIGLSACGGGGGTKPPPTSTLTVTITGGGFVASTPAGIDCHADCSEAYAQDTIVTLVPFANAGQSFSGWSGDADCSDGSVTMSTAHQCTAIFALTGGPRIAAGKDFSLARSRGGNTYTWGSDANEALGNGVAAHDRSAPGLSALSAAIDTIATAAGAEHSLAIERSTGRVWGWGDNWAGQLGDRSQVARADPVLMRDANSDPVTAAVAVAVGAGHSLVLRADGTVSAVGLNDQGQLGDGTSSSRDFAAPVPNVCGSGMAATAISAGADFSLVLCADGSVRAWGANGDGQLGDGSFAYRPTPIRVKGLSGHIVKAIAAGADFALALDTDGFVWSWGSNSRGQLGTDSTLVAHRNLPAHVDGFAGGVAIAAGLNHAMVLLANNAVFGWGANDSGQISPADRDSGVSQFDFSYHVAGLPSIVEITAGNNHSLAIDSSGAVWSWGGNNTGQLGIGSTTSPGKPTRISGLDLN